MNKHTHTSPIHSHTHMPVYLYPYCPLSQLFHTIYSHVKIPILPLHSYTHTLLHTLTHVHAYIYTFYSFTPSIYLLRHICYPHINIPVCMTHTQSWPHPDAYTYHLSINMHRPLSSTYLCLSKCHICHTHIKHTCHPNLFLLCKKSFVIG